MALPFERWARQALKREKDYDFTPVATTRVLNDVRDLARLHKQTWRYRQRELIHSGVPTAMPEGTYGGLIAYPPAATITTTSINGTVNLWPAATYSPLLANAFLTPQAYRIAIMGKITTVAAPGNLGFDPRIGAPAWTTGGTAITGTTMGATGNVALTASITNAFYYVMGDLTIRSVGVPGATGGTIVGMFHAVSTQNTAAGVAGPAATSAPFNLLFGGTTVQWDFSVNSGFSLGAVHTVATITHNVEQVHFMDWN